MCEIEIYRIRILQELIAVAREASQPGATNRDQLMDRCLRNLQNHYTGLCPDEVLHEKALSFVTWYAARQAPEAPPRTNQPMAVALAA